jgi:hypothetical protein
MRFVQCLMEPRAWRVSLVFNGAVSACIVYYRYFTPVSDVNRESGVPAGNASIAALLSSD